MTRFWFLKNKGNPRGPFFYGWCLLVLFLFLSQFSWTQVPRPVFRTYFDEPVPFTVDARAAQLCIDMLKSARFLLYQPPDGPSSILTVRQVWAVYTRQDETYPPGYRRRYDIHVNDEPIDWPYTYVEYAGEMTSLKVLFTYRNQDPGGGYEYLLGGR